MCRSIILFALLFFALACVKEDITEPIFQDFMGKFVFSDYIQSTNQIFILDHTNSRKITKSTSNKVSPQWFPDGKNIMYLSKDLERLYIHIMDSQGLNDRALFDIGTSSVGFFFYPQIHLSPDGRFVAIGRADSVIILSVQPAELLTRLTAFSCITEYKHLVWAPDSKKFSCACPGSDSLRHLHVFNVDTHQLQDLTEFLGHTVIDQSWNYTSSLIGFISSGDIYTIKPDGTDMQKIVNSDHFLEAELSFSPFDDRIVYERADSLFDLVMYDVQSQTTQVLLDDKKYISGPLIWVENAKFIFYGYGDKTFKLNQFRMFEIKKNKSYPVLETKAGGFQWIAD